VNITNSPTNVQAKAIAYRPKRAALNWADYLVIAATVATFAVVVAVNNPHAARAQTRSTLVPAADLPTQSSQLHDDAGLIKAKIGLATSRPWG
jgi:hypothetical protein